MSGSRVASTVRTVLITAALTSAAWMLGLAFYWDRFSTPPEGPAQPQAQPSEAPFDEPAVDTPADAPGRVEMSATPAQPLTTGALAIPVAGVSPASLSDSFGDARGGGERQHEAIDIMAPTGTAVVAAAPGTIEKLFLSDQGGNTIYQRSADGRTIYYYAHLQDYASGLEEGAQVQRGQRIGTVGYSGNANPEAPHLHFAVMNTSPDGDWWDASEAVNPYPLLVRSGN